MKRSVLILLAIVMMAAATASAQPKNIWKERLIATNSFLQKHMWNATTGNFVRRADVPNAPGTDAWGVTIMLDAYAYMVESGLLSAEDLKRYYYSSSGLYEKTDGDHGARILAKQGRQIYIGGDDDMQWAAALAHCYIATKDPAYLNAAKYAFNALVTAGFWISGPTSRGWAWNSSDKRPNGVSTAYGALAAARLYAATKESTYRDWAITSLTALETPQVGFFPRDMMVAASAALTIREVTHDEGMLTRAKGLAATARTQVREILSGKRPGERNPTDVADLAEGFYRLSDATKDKTDRALASELINFFVGKRTAADISEKGFSSRYDAKGHPVTEGAYLGVPLAIAFLPEVAEMLKLFAISYAH